MEVSSSTMALRGPLLRIHIRLGVNKARYRPLLWTLVLPFQVLLVYGMFVYVYTHMHIHIYVYIHAWESETGKGSMYFPCISGLHWCGIHKEGSRVWHVSKSVHHNTG